MPGAQPEAQRAAQRESWEKAAAGWDRWADRIRDWGMPVSAAMVDALALQPGQRVLELAAGPGDTGFLAAELIQPSGTLISSDGAEAMLEVARRRAVQAGLTNVEFRQLELEWIDLETASVDAVLCRWGIMLIVDPEAAAQEIRRVLRSGGRGAFAVWDEPARNPWATIPTGVMVSCGHAEPPDPDGPSMFALAAPGRLEGLLETAGFTDVVVRPQELVREFTSVAHYVTEQTDMSPVNGAAYRGLGEDERSEIISAIAEGVRDFIAEDGSVVLPGSSLVAVATA